MNYLPPLKTLNMAQETIQEWIDAFEAKMRERFNNVYLRVSVSGIKGLDVEQVIFIVAQKSGIELRKIKGKYRGKQEVTDARSVAIYFCLKLFNINLRQLATHFANRNHATLIHSRRTILERLETKDYHITNLVNKVQDELNNILNREQDATIQN